MTEKSAILDKLNRFFTETIRDNPAFTTSDGSIGGFYSASLIQRPESQHSYWIIPISITPFSGKQNTLMLHIPRAEENKREEYLRSARTYFNDKKFIDSTQPLSQGNLNRVATETIQHIRTQHRDEFQPITDEQSRTSNIPAGTVGIYSVSLAIPATDDKISRSIGIHFIVRPIGDYFKAGKEYILTPHGIDISTGYHDIGKARELLSGLKTELEKQHIFEYALPQSLDTTKGKKALPYAWINPHALKVKRYTNDAYYSLEIVSNEGRRPLVSFSLKTSDAGKAEAMRAAAEEYLTTCLSGDPLLREPITIEDIRKFVHQKIKPDEKKPLIKSPTDQREIFANGEPVIRINTPQLVTQKRTDEKLYHGYILRFAPSSVADDAEDVLHSVKKPKRRKASHGTLNGNLNTSDETIARRRLHTLQNLAELALDEYFIANPHMRVIAERLGAENQRVRFRAAAPGQLARENEIFFADLAERVIKPALNDFDRYIYWQTNIRAGGDNWTVSFQPKRNMGEDMPPDLSSLSGTLTVTADSKESARAFAHALELAILEQQKLHSRERPVESFGEPTTRLVIRESLRKALSEYKTHLNLGDSKQLAELMRPGRDPTD